MNYTIRQYKNIKQKIEKKAETETEKKINLLFLDANFKFIDANMKKYHEKKIVGEIDGIWFQDNVFILVEVKNKNKKAITKDMNHFFNTWTDAENLEWLRNKYGKLRAKFIRVFFDYKNNDTENKKSRAHIFRGSPKENFYFNKIDCKYFLRQRELIGKYVKFDMLNALEFKREKNLQPVQAIVTEMKKQEILITALSVKDLLEMCYVTRKKKLSGYQRMLNHIKLREIYAEIIRKGSLTFPNSIIITPSEGKEISIPKKNEAGAFPFVRKIIIPSDYCSFRVIDGQHRLFGFTKINTRKPTEKRLLDEHLVVIILNNISHDSEINTFIKINSTHSRMDPNLLETLKSGFKYRPNHEFYDDKLAVLLSKKLNETHGSPYKNLIDFGVLEDQLSEERKPIKLKTLSTQFLRNKIIGQKNVFSIERKNIDEYYKIVVRILRILKTDSTAKAFMLDNRGIRVLFRLVAVIQRNLNHNLVSENINDIFEDIKGVIARLGLERILDYGEGGASNAFKNLIIEIKQSNIKYTNLTSEMKKIPLPKT